MGTEVRELLKSDLELHQRSFPRAKLRQILPQSRDYKHRLFRSEWLLLVLDEGPKYVACYVSDRPTMAQKQYIVKSKNNLLSVYRLDFLLKNQLHCRQVRLFVP